MMSNAKMSGSQANLNFRFSDVLLVSLLMGPIALVFGRVDSSTEHKEPHSCHWRESELCIIGAGSFIQNPNGLPVKPAELERQCELFDEASDCSMQYSEKCHTKTQSMLGQMVSGHIYKLQREFCNEASQLRQNYTREAPCMRDVQRKHQNECFQDLQVGFESIHKLNSTDKMMATMCCNVERLKKCFMPRIEEKCGQNAMNLMSHLLEAVVGNRVMTVLCRKYDSESAECKKLLPPPGTKPINSRQTSALSRIISAYTRIQPK